VPSSHPRTTGPETPGSRGVLRVLACTEGTDHAADVHSRP